MNLIQSGLTVAILAAMSNFGPSAAIAQVEEERTQSSADTTPSLLAQASPTPFCRRPNRRLDVYSQPSVGDNSASRATIESDTNLFLVERTSGGGFVIEEGFVEVIVPSANSTLGYVIARHLKGCVGGDPDPEPQAQCARVNVSFLTVRDGASLNARAIGELRGGQTVRIVGDSPGAVQPRRIWVQIPFGGRTGWTAETGAFGTSRNLSDRFTCP
ncbi:MAG: SH3 domain-containing protein [Elainellaceae cyanobacterium]